MKAGLPPAIAAGGGGGSQARRHGCRPALVRDFCAELHETKHVSDATYAATKRPLRRAGIIDLIAVCGYYVAVAMTLNVAQVPLPPGVPVPLKPL